MDLSHFFRATPKSVPVSIPRRLTYVLSTVDDGDGKFVVRPVCLEAQANPLVALNFDDFTISSMLKNGVSYKSLMISPDLRLGFDSEIDAFNASLEERVDKLFNFDYK